MGNRVRGFNSRCGTLSRYVTNHPDQLSLAIPLWVNAIEYPSKSGNALRLESIDRYGSCWVAGKTVLSLVTHEQYMSALEIKSLHMNRYITSAVYFTLFHAQKSGAIAITCNQFGNF